jgi:hypothetical protein
VPGEAARVDDATRGLDVVLTDAGERYRLRLANGVLTYSGRPPRRERRTRR